jgi:ATP-binding cassette, subfamily B, bacterial
VPFLYYSAGIYGKRVTPRLERVQGLEWQSLSIVHESMAMLRVIVSFGREQYEFKRFREQGETAVEERVKLTVRQTLFTLLVNTITAAGTAGVLGYGFYLVLEGRLDIGKLIVLLSYVAAVYQPLEAISGSVGVLHNELVQLRGSFQLLDTTPEVVDDPRAVELDRARGDVAYENVSFSYHGRKDTLQDVSFHARAGERVAIVGPTGAGKTTLMSLLVRFYDPREGRILVDGVDLRALKLRSLRDQISVVLQEPLLFSGTVAENIRYGRLDATMDQIVEAAKSAGAHDFIERLPQGYETELGERGARLSGGERQRICVARAFIKDAPILILDEPTSSIDSKTEAVILDSLEQLMAGRTSFMIAHRLSTIRQADKIVVIDKGRIVEQGTHSELLAKHGLYRQLHEAQTRRGRVVVPKDLEERLRNALSPREEAGGPGKERE